MAESPLPASVPESPPSPWIERWLDRASVGDRVLDFASGRGRNMRRAVQQGAEVLAVDWNPQAVAGIAPRAQVLVADLEGEPWPFSPRSFDFVVVCNYLFRPRLSLLIDLLAPGGALLYETFAVGNEAYGRPSNPDFLLRPGELLDAARAGGLAVIAYEDGHVERPKPARVQRICAVRPPVPYERWNLESRVG